MKIQHLLSHFKLLLFITVTAAGLMGGSIAWGEYEPNYTVERRQCSIANGNGYQYRRVNPSDGVLKDWGACTAEPGSCNPGYISRSTGSGGKSSDCRPGDEGLPGCPISICVLDGVCPANFTETQSCSLANGTGKQTRTCNSDGSAWGPWGPCTGSSRPSLTVVRNTNGVVSSNPPGNINCGNGAQGGSCSQSWQLPVRITLRATPNTGFIVDRWSGCTPFGPTKQACTVEVTNSHEVLISYKAGELPSCNISVASSNPALVNGKIPQGRASLTFNIIPSPGAQVAQQPYPFLEPNFAAENVWRYFPATVRDSESRYGYCDVKVEQLGVALGGTEPVLAVIPNTDGVVRSTNGGIGCGNQQLSCSQKFSSPTRVELQATPNPGFAVSQWFGCTTSSANTCVVDVNSPKTVRVSYRRLSPTCTISIASSTPALVNGKIPQEGATLTFNINPIPSSAQISRPNGRMSANSTASPRTRQFEARVTNSSGSGTCSLSVEQLGITFCPLSVEPICSGKGSTCVGGCVQTYEGDEINVAVRVDLSMELQNFVNTMKGTESILDSSFETVIRALPNAQMSRVEEIIFSDQHDRLYFRSIEIGNRLTILFERLRGPKGYFVWVPRDWAPGSWQPDLSLDEKNRQLVSMRRNGEVHQKTEAFLNTLEAVANALPGVYGTQQLIFGDQKILGAVSLATDVASFGIGKGLTVIGKTAISSTVCRAVVITGAAARITNAIQNPSLGTGVDAALATVEGALVGVKFVRVVVRNGRGFIRANSSGSGARVIAQQLGRNLEDISVGGRGLSCGELAALGIKPVTPEWNKFAGEFIDEVKDWSDSTELSIFAERNGSRIGEFTGNTIYNGTKTVNLGFVKIFGDSTTCRFGLNGTQLYQSLFTHPLIKKNPGLWKLSSYFGEDNKKAFDCAYDAAIASGKTADEAIVAGTKNTQWHKIMVERLGARISKYPPNRSTLSIEVELNLPLSQ